MFSPNDEEARTTDERVSEWAQATLERTGVSSVAEAHHTLVAVLEAMGEILTQDEAESIARELPAELSEVVRRGASRASVPAAGAALDAFVHGVEWRENIPATFAFEHASAVCGLLSERLPADTRKHLMADLPLAVARLLAPTLRPVRPERPPRPAPGETQRNTLAAGRAGSTHPVSESRPETAHSQSVARSDDPHAGSKLSSSAGLTQERLGDSLASGRPGPTRKVSESN
jgi:uncharacterized protein (DUF2267 family)